MQHYSRRVHTVVNYTRYSVQRTTLTAIATIGVLLTFIFTILPPVPTGAQATVTLTIASVYADGVQPAPSMWTVLHQNGVLVATGFTPVTFNVSPGVSYTVSTADYTGVMKVEVSIDGDPFMRADGLTKWSFMDIGLVRTVSVKE
jgi:hypothetical protein